MKKGFRQNSTGFTLIETLVYLALFALMIGGIVAASFLLFESSDRNSEKARLQEEKNFIVGKIDWALSGAKTVASPSAGASGSTLTATKYDGTSNTISIAGSNVNQNGAQLNNSN